MASKQGNKRTPDVLRISLVGKTGCGKSSTGNTILGRKEFVAKVKSTSVTQLCSKAEADVDGRRVAIVDTPGLFDTSLPNHVVIKETYKSISLLAPGPHAFLLVIQIGRFTKEEKDAVEYIKAAFGEDADKYIMVLFTRGDDLEDEETSIEEYINEADDSLKSLIADCGNRFHVFNNREQTDRTQVKELLQKIDDMVEKNGGSCYTSEMLREAERAIQEKTKEIMKEKDEEIKREMKKIMRKYQKEIEEQKLRDKERQEEEKRQMEKAFKELEEKIRKDQELREKEQREREKRESQLEKEREREQKERDKRERDIERERERDQRERERRERQIEKELEKQREMHENMERQQREREQRELREKEQREREHRELREREQREREQREQVQRERDVEYRKEMERKRDEEVAKLIKKYEDDARKAAEQNNSFLDKVGQAIDAAVDKVGDALKSAGNAVAKGVLSVVKWFTR